MVDLTDLPKELAPVGIAPSMDINMTPRTPSPTKRRLSVGDLNNTNSSPSKRRSVAELMRSSPRKAPPPPSIDAALRALAEKLKEVPEYPITKGNPFLGLDYDLHVHIFEKLAGNRVFDICAASKALNSLRAMRLVNKQMNVMVKEWAGNKKQVKFNLMEPPLPYWKLDKEPPALYKYHISPDVGLFNSETATFFLDVAIFEDASPSDLEIERRCARARMVTFLDSEVHQRTVRHVKFKVRTIAEMREWFPYLRNFRNIDSVEVTVKDVATGSMNAPNHFGHFVWEIFWQTSGWHHPGACCDCCVLPDLQVQEVGSKVSESRVHAVPGRLQLPENMEEKKKSLIARRTARWYARDNPQ